MTLDANKKEGEFLTSSLDTFLLDYNIDVKIVFFNFLAPPPFGAHLF